MGISGVKGIANYPTDMGTEFGGMASKSLSRKSPPYGAMGCWQKGQTKNGRPQELPLPTQYMPWLAAWLAIRPARCNPYLFPGQLSGRPLSIHTVQYRWEALCAHLEIHGLWELRSPAHVGLYARQ